MFIFLLTRCPISPQRFLALSRHLYMRSILVTDLAGDRRTENFNQVYAAVCQVITNMRVGIPLKPQLGCTPYSYGVNKEDITNMTCKLYTPCDVRASF
jgi:hypothetical protein